MRHMPSVMEHPLQKKARLGFFLLAGRTVVLQLLVLGGNIFLARKLTPKEFGIFAIVQFALTFLSFFGDAGLGGALIQKKDPPTQAELSSVFLAQVGMSCVVVGLAWIGSLFLHRIWSDVPSGSVWLLRALSFSVVFTSLRVVPSILMERDMQFGRLSAIDITGTVAFYISAVWLSATGVGVWALVVGVLVQGAVGLVMGVWARPWKPSLILDRAALRSMARFGIPFQLKNIVGFINGAVMPIYAGTALGAKSVGLIGWAQSTAYLPLRLVDTISRVNFPLYSRLREQPAVFEDSLSRSIQLCGMVTLFYVGILFGIAPPLINVVYSAKWLEALVPLYIFAASVSLGFLAPLVSAALDAAGRPKVFARLSIGWTVLAWAVVPLTTPRWGMLGFVYGYVVHVIVGNIAVIIVLGTLMPLRKLWIRTRASLLGCLVVSVIGRLGMIRLVTGPVTLVFCVLMLAAVFMGVVALFDSEARDRFAAGIRSGLRVSQQKGDVGST